MKKTLAAVSLVVLLFLAAFYVAGTRVESILQDAAARLQSRTPGLSLALKSKTGGLFTSNYVYSFDYALPDSRQTGSKRLAGDLIVAVAHGPLPVAAGTWTPCLAQATVGLTVGEGCDPDIRSFVASFPELASSTATTRLALDTSAVIRLAVPAFAKTVTDAAGQSTTLAWKGLEGEWRLPAGYQSVRGTLSAPGLTVQAKEATFSFEGLNAEMNSRSLTAFLWAGQHQFRLASLSVAPENAPPVMLKSLRADAAITPKAEVLDYAFTLSGEYEKQQRLLPASMRFALHDLDIVAMNELMELLNRAQSQGTPPFPEQEMRSLGSALLSRSPSLEMDLSAMEGDSRLDLRCEAHAEGLPSLPAAALQALPSLRAKVDFTGQEKSLVEFLCSLSGASGQAGLMEPCLQAIAKQVDQLVGQGLLLRQGDRLTSQAAWNGRAAVVNGKELP